MDTRSSTLTQIIKIDQRVQKTLKSTRYRSIQHNLRTLKNTTGHAIITVQDPQDMTKRITLRKNSEKAKQLLQRYQQLSDQYQRQFKELQKQKNTLKKTLFR